MISVSRFKNRVARRCDGAGAFETARLTGDARISNADKYKITRNRVKIRENKRKLFK